jgi:hypothetical protein
MSPRETLILKPVVESELILPHLFYDFQNAFLNLMSSQYKTPCLLARTRRKHNMVLFETSDVSLFNYSVSRQTRPLTNLGKAFWGPSPRLTRGRVVEEVRNIFTLKNDTAIYIPDLQRLL